MTTVMIENILKLVQYLASQSNSPHVGLFVRRSSLNIKPNYSGSNCWYTFRIDDVINDVIITYFHGHSFTSMVHPHIKLSDHTSKRFIVIVKSVIISFKREYRRLNLTLRCDVTDDVTSVKHTFSGKICNDLLEYDVKMNLSKIFRNFQNGRHFEVRVIS